MKKTGGARRKTRNMFKKHNKEKGKMSLQRYLQQFKEGDNVTLSVESSVQKGMYYPPFYGKNGIITAKKGKCYEVAINDQGKQKSLIIHPVHLKRV